MDDELKNPSDGLFGDVHQEGFGCDSSRHNRRLDRYSLAHDRAKNMVTYLNDTVNSLTEGSIKHYQLSRLHSTMSECGNYLVFRKYIPIDQTRLHAASFCKKHLLCPLCAIRRGSKSLAAYVERYQYLLSENSNLKASLITLTVKNGEDLFERYDHLNRSKKRLIDNRRDALKKGRGRTVTRFWKGYVGTIEVTNKGNGWHPHTHLIVLHDESMNHRKHQECLSEEWKRITGDSYIVDVRPLQNPSDPASDFVEVFKYALKFSDLNPRENLHAALVLKGRRLLYSGGLFRGIKIPDELTDESIEDLPYVELFYNYIDNVGYSLSSVSEIVEPTVIDLKIQA
jgi:hypothetical protein